MKASAAQSCLTLRPHGLARRAPLSMTPSKRERWSGRHLPDPWIKPRPPALQADSSLAAPPPPGKPAAGRISPSSEDREWLPATSEERPSPCLQGTRPSEAQRPRHLLLAGCATPWPPACHLRWEGQAARPLTVLQGRLVGTAANTFNPHPRPASIASRVAAGSPPHWKLPEGKGWVLFSASTRPEDSTTVC